MTPESPVVAPGTAAAAPPAALSAWPAELATEQTISVREFLEGVDDERVLAQMEQMARLRLTHDEDAFRTLDTKSTSLLGTLGLTTALVGAFAGSVLPAAVKVQYVGFAAVVAFLAMVVLACVSALFAAWGTFTRVYEVLDDGVLFPREVPPLDAKRYLRIQILAIDVVRASVSVINEEKAKNLGRGQRVFVAYLGVLVLTIFGSVLAIVSANATTPPSIGSGLVFDGFLVAALLVIGAAAFEALKHLVKYVRGRKRASD